MHYYQFNIGDYLSHTRHLTPIEDICYRRALDYYYLHEQPLSLDIDNLTRLLCFPKDYRGQVENILDEFFEKTSDGYINPRADKEIQQYQSFVEAGKLGAAKRWLKGDYSPPTPPPMLNNNHKTINNKQYIYSPPEGVDPSVWNDYLKLRRAKKLPMTATALKGIQREADKAKKTLNETIIICVENSWAGFKAEWLEKEKEKKQDKTWMFSDKGIENKAKELGLKPNPHDTYHSLKERCIKKMAEDLIR
jgi:hypothetical protein